jgi:acyl-CoA reductase-like NAD-dependent aldehyde dehydrogenase
VMMSLTSPTVMQDVDVINTLTRSLKYGTVWVNSFGARDVAMPYGGGRLCNVLTYRLV